VAFEEGQFDGCAMELYVDCCSGVVDVQELEGFEELDGWVYEMWQVRSGGRCESLGRFRVVDGEIVFLDEVDKFAIDCPFGRFSIMVTVEPEGEDETNGLNSPFLPILVGEVD